MPREDVPYPTGAICSIRERIAELRDELDQLLKTVNGVAGDANHDIKLVSGDPAIVINNDQAQHEIEIALDSSQLPAAAVSSVNGQTGAVVLDGDDLDGVTPGNSVNDDIAALQGADVTLQGNINAEATARANADSSLSTAINAALATIPGEVSSQIANDATINQLVAADAQNVKLTGAQNVGGVKTFSSIPLVPTANPGSTDQSAANTNWISQTGDSSPNNLVHRSGNETINGTKTFEALTPVMSRSTKYQRVTASGNWYKVFSLTNTGRQVVIMDIIWAHQSYNGYGAGRVAMAAIGGNTAAKWLYKQGNASAFSDDSVFIGIGSSSIDIWVKGGYYVYCDIVRAIRGNVETPVGEIVNVYDGTGYASIDTSAYTNYAYSST